MRFLSLSFFGTLVFIGVLSCGASRIKSDGIAKDVEQNFNEIVNSSSKIPKNEQELDEMIDLIAEATGKTADEARKEIDLDNVTQKSLSDEKKAVRALQAARLYRDESYKATKTEDGRNQELKEKLYGSAKETGQLAKQAAIIGTLLKLAKEQNPRDDAIIMELEEALKKVVSDSESAIKTLGIFSTFKEAGSMPLINQRSRSITDKKNEAFKKVNELKRKLALKGRFLQELPKE